MRTLMQIIAENPSTLIRIFGIDQQPNTLADTYIRLAEDIRHLQTVGTPGQTELDDAPFIDNWTAAFSPIGIVLIGVIENHPSLLGPVITTSPIMVIDHDLQWARSLNRYYRLGAPALVSQSTH